MNGWAELIQEQLGKSVGPVPEGFESLDDIAQQLAVSHGHASKLMLRLLKKGAVERFDSGRVAYYRPVRPDGECRKNRREWADATRLDAGC